MGKNNINQIIIQMIIKILLSELEVFFLIKNVYPL